MFTLALSVLTLRFSQLYETNTGSLTPSPPPQRHQFLIPRTCKCYLVSKGGLCSIFQWGDYLGLFGWALMPSLVSGKRGRFERQKRRKQCACRGDWRWWECQQPCRTRSGEDLYSPPEPLEGAQPCSHLDFSAGNWLGLLASITVSEYMSMVVSHQVCGKRKLIHY